MGIQAEVRRHQTPGLGISYRKFQYILCLHAMSIDPACDMPLEEKEARAAEESELRRTRCALLLQAAWAGQKGRKELGVENVGSGMSPEEEKAASFKKKFADLMNNPNTKLTAPATLAVAAPAAAPAASAAQAQDVNETRNVFLEKARQRVAAQQARKGQ